MSIRNLFTESTTVYEKISPANWNAVANGGTPGSTIVDGGDNITVTPLGNNVYSVSTTFPAPASADEGMAVGVSNGVLTYIPVGGTGTATKVAAGDNITVSPLVNETYTVSTSFSAPTTAENGMALGVTNGSFAFIPCVQNITGSENVLVGGTATEPVISLPQTLTSIGIDGLSITGAGIFPANLGVSGQFLGVNGTQDGMDWLTPTGGGGGSIYTGTQNQILVDNVNNIIAFDDAVNPIHINNGIEFDFNQNTAATIGVGTSVNTDNNLSSLFMYTNYRTESGLFDAGLQVSDAGVELISYKDGYHLVNWVFSSIPDPIDPEHNPPTTTITFPDGSVQTTAYTGQTTGVKSFTAGVNVNNDNGTTTDIILDLDKTLVALDAVTTKALNIGDSTVGTYALPEYDDTVQSGYLVAVDSVTTPASITTKFIAPPPVIPAVTSADNGQYLKVTDGVYALGTGGGSSGVSSILNPSPTSGSTDNILASSNTGDVTLTLNTDIVVGTFSSTGEGMLQVLDLDTSSILVRDFAGEYDMYYPKGITGSLPLGSYMGILDQASASGENFASASLSMIELATDSNISITNNFPASQEPPSNPTTTIGLNDTINVVTEVISPAITVSGSTATETYTLPTYTETAGSTTSYVLAIDTITQGGEVTLNWVPNGSGGDGVATISNPSPSSGSTDNILASSPTGNVTLTLNDTINVTTEVITPQLTVLGSTALETYSLPSYTGTAGSTEGYVLAIDTITQNGEVTLNWIENGSGSGTTIANPSPSSGSTDNILASSSTGSVALTLNDTVNVTTEVISPAITVLGSTALETYSLPTYSVTAGSPVGQILSIESVTQGGEVTLNWADAVNSITNSPDVGNTPNDNNIFANNSTGAVTLKLNHQIQLTNPTSPSTSNEAKITIDVGTTNLSPNGLNPPLTGAIFTPQLLATAITVQDQTNNYLLPYANDTCNLTNLNSVLTISAVAINEPNALNDATLTWAPVVNSISNVTTDNITADNSTGTVKLALNDNIVLGTQAVANSASISVPTCNVNTLEIYNGTETISFPQANTTGSLGQPLGITSIGTNAINLGWMPIYLATQGTIGFSSQVNTDVVSKENAFVVECSLVRCGYSITMTLQTSTAYINILTPAGTGVNNYLQVYTGPNDNTAFQTLCNAINYTGQVNATFLGQRYIVSTTSNITYLCNFWIQGITIYIQAGQGAGLGTITPFADDEYKFCGPQTWDPNAIGYPQSDISFTWGTN